MCIILIPAARLQLYLYFLRFVFSFSFFCDDSNLRLTMTWHIDTSSSAPFSKRSLSCFDFVFVFNVHVASIHSQKNVFWASGKKRKVHLGSVRNAESYSCFLSVRQRIKIKKICRQAHRFLFVCSLYNRCESRLNKSKTVDKFTQNYF